MAGLVVMFLVSPFVINSLGKIEYGIWSLLVVVTGYMGMLDLGVRASTGRYVILYLGKGDRSFELLDVAGSSFDHPRSLWVADFNGDSHPDLAIGTAALAPTGDEPVRVLIARP